MVNHNAGPYSVDRLQDHWLPCLGIQGIDWQWWLARGARKHQVFTRPCEDDVTHLRHAVNDRTHCDGHKVVEVEAAMLRLPDSMLHDVFEARLFVLVHLADRNVESVVLSVSLRPLRRFLPPLLPLPLDRLPPASLISCLVGLSACLFACVVCLVV